MTRKGSRIRVRFATALAVGVLVTAAFAPIALAAQRPRSGAAPEISAISCSSTSVCELLAIAGPGKPEILGTSNGGTTWKAQSVPKSAYTLNTISCPSTTTCYVAAEGESAPEVLMTANGGKSWTVQHLPSAMYGAFGISCHANTTCEVVGDTDTGSLPAGYIVGTTTGGKSWKVQSPPVGEGKVYSVSCASATVCVAGGLGAITGGKASGTSSAIIGTRDGGAVWTSRIAPSGVIVDTSIACPTPSVCEGVGELDTTAAEMIGTSNEGVTWKAQTAPSKTDRLESVSCKYSSSCMAAVQDRKSFTSSSGVVLVMSKLGGPWIPHTLPTVAHAPTSVSCSSALICELAGNNSADTVGFVLRTTNGGKTWVTQELP